MKFKPKLALKTWLIGIAWSRRDHEKEIGWPFSHFAIHIGPIQLAWFWNVEYPELL